MSCNSVSPPQPLPLGFSANRFDAAECRRLRLALRLTADKMAIVARMPGRWAWLSVENGYEAIDPERWATCLAELDSRPPGGPKIPTTPNHRLDWPGCGQLVGP